MIYKNESGVWVTDDLPTHDYSQLGYDKWRFDWIKYRPYEGKDPEYYEGDRYTNERNNREFKEQYVYNGKPIYGEPVDKSKIRLPTEIHTGNFFEGETFYGFAAYTKDYNNQRDILPCKLFNIGEITNGFRVISYIDFLNKFLMVVENPYAREFGEFNDSVDYYDEVETKSGNKNDLDIYRIGLQPVGLIYPGNLYYFKVKQDDIFPNYMKNKYVVFRLYRVFPSSDSEVTDSTIWLPKTKGDVTQYTALYWCYIVGVYDTEEEITSNSKLRGFRKVIDDNRYFDRIPQINEVTHWDNGIISNTLVKVDYNIIDDPEQWDKFTLSHETIVDRTISIMKMLKPEHEMDR